LILKEISALLVIYSRCYSLQCSARSPFSFSFSFFALTSLPRAWKHAATGVHKRFSHFIQIARICVVLFI